MSDDDYYAALVGERERLRKAEEQTQARRREIESLLGQMPDGDARHKVERQLEQADRELAELGKRILAIRAGRVRYTQGDPIDMLSPKGRNQLIMEAGRRGLADGI